MNYNNNKKKTKPEFFWYALNIGSNNIESIISELENLKTPRISKIINLSDIFTKSKIKNRILFIQANLSNKLKKAILEIEGIRFFIPRNVSPYIFSDIEDFLKYHFDKNDLSTIKQKYLHDHEINNQSKLDNNNTISTTKINYRVGDTIIINHGIFKEHYGIITDIKDDIVHINVQIDNGRANINASMHFSDTELIKSNKE